MGMDTTLFKCPHCRQQMGDQTGPNYATINAPGAMTGNVIVLVCVNAQCQAVLGSYFVPNQN